MPGIELRTAGDLHLSNAWDLSIVNYGPSGELWRFGDLMTTPGVLTLRAGGSLYVDQSLSDGFYGLDPYNGGYQLFAGLGESWSYRLVAGADFSSSQPLAVSTAGQLAASAGNVVVAPGRASDPYNVNGPTVVRTGTGFIDVAAGRNLSLGNQASVIYTAGMPSPNGLSLLDSDSGLIGYSYPTAGGRVRINAGLDIVGAPNNQLFTDWLWRAGSAAGAQSSYAPTAWLVAYGNFEQGIGAFGGGDLSVLAGRNIIDLGANVPTIGVPVGDAKRIFRGIELVAKKRVGDSLWIQASYLYSTLKGNYSGAISTASGQTDPGINADFDYYQFQNNAYGALELDRPHQFRLDTAYRKGAHAYFEFVTADDSPNSGSAEGGRAYFGAAEVVFHHGSQPPKELLVP
ncbi:MAG: hypothetical protein WCJ30_28580, partial [Deltaproteobacteria bacterium]